MTQGASTVKKLVPFAQVSLTGGSPPAASASAGGVEMETEVMLPDFGYGQEQRPIGIWGERHLRYIREHRKSLYTELLTSGRLNDYLAELNGEAEDMLFRRVKQLAEKEGVTEALKAEDGMKWTQAMNNIRSRAEEAVYSDLIHN